MKWLWMLLVVIVVAAAVAIGWGQWRWRGLTQALITGLDAARVAQPAARFDAARLADLPDPVRRYLQSAIEADTPPVAAVSMAHAGEFNLGESADRWRPFTSTQRVVARRPGFVWDARISMLPGLSVHVHDAYVAGEGRLRPAVAGIVTLMDLHGGGEIARGELLRFLAEAAWYPTVLLPGHGVRWEAIDTRWARATLVDGAVSASLDFEFGADGMIAAVRTDARGRTVGDAVVPTPWEGRWWNYEWRQGMRVPTHGEVAWVLKEGRKVYWKGTLTSVRYEFDPVP